MPGTPASYRFQMQTGGEFVTPDGLGTGITEVVVKLGKFEDLGYEPEELEEMIRDLKRAC